MIEEPRHHRHPILRGIGHALGVLYLLVTLLFGPIRSLAAWLERRRLIQRYERWVAGLPPAAGLAGSLLALGLLEVAKLAVLLSLRYFGLVAAAVVTVGAKASLGYFAHVTWRAARPKVIAAYPWAARVDAWVGAQLTLLRGFRDRWLGSLRRRSWYPGVVNVFRTIRKRAAAVIGWIKARWATAFG
jgi:hypothetical protein